MGGWGIRAGDLWASVMRGSLGSGHGSLRGKGSKEQNREGPRNQTRPILEVVFGGAGPIGL